MDDCLTTFLLDMVLKMLPQSFLSATLRAHDWRVPTLIQHMVLELFQAWKRQLWVTFVDAFERGLVEDGLSDNAWLALLLFWVDRVIFDAGRGGAEVFIIVARTADELFVAD